MKAVPARAEKYCVYVKPQNVCSTNMSLFHTTCLTIGPIQLFISSFYLKSSMVVMMKMVVGDGDGGVDGAVVRVVASVW